MASSRCFSRDDLAPFNLLVSPIWVFDIERKGMWWANEAAVDLWSANSLESLLARDFASDMSESTEKKLHGYLDRFRKGESFPEQVCVFFLGRERFYAWLG